MKTNFNYEQQEENENDPGNCPNALSIWKINSILDWNLCGLDKVFRVDQANLKPNLLPLQSKRWDYKSVSKTLAPVYEFCHYSLPKCVLQS